jgi:hypothetical protein
MAIIPPLWGYVSFTIQSSIYWLLRIWLCITFVYFISPTAHTPDNCVSGVGRVFLYGKSNEFTVLNHQRFPIVFLSIPFRSIAQQGFVRHWSTKHACGLRPCLCSYFGLLMTYHFFGSSIWPWKLVFKIFSVSELSLCRVNLSDNRQNRKKSYRYWLLTWHIVGVIIFSTTLISVGFFLWMLISLKSGTHYC